MQINSVILLVIVLDIDWKIPLTSHMSCVGDIIGYVLFPKVNRTQIPQWKCHGNYIGGLLEGLDAGSRKTFDIGQMSFKTKM